MKDANIRRESRCQAAVGYCTMFECLVMKDANIRRESRCQAAVGLDLVLRH